MFLTVSKEGFFLIVHLYVLYKDIWGKVWLSYFDDAQVAVCRFSEMSHTMKIFRTASEFFSVSQVKCAAGSPLRDFSAESLAPTNTFPTWSTAQQWPKPDFWEKKFPMVARPLHCSSWGEQLPLPGEPLSPLSPGECPAWLGSGQLLILPSESPLPTWMDGGLEVEFQWNYCISCWVMIFF